ncbi:hypothetical protein VTO42DRAFT_7930 [Malbranchea cinnamomea]
MQSEQRRPDPRPPLRSSHRGRSTSLSVESPHLLRAAVTPPLVIPQPQYIAAAPAAQIIAADQDIPPGDAHVSSQALALLNGFLDHLLFHILLTARSTRLLAIRPALSDVLKPRLAREVVAAANEELRAYTGDDEDEELSSFHVGHEPAAAGHFELERSWKLTRLRCMVYTRLGDMEEADEEEHRQREGLDDGPHGHHGGRGGRFAAGIGHVTPAAAMFLTAVLEYIGESALIIAGEAARLRTIAAANTVAAKQDEQQSDDPAAANDEPLGALVVEDVDIERLALNPTLGRLWRAWRKNARMPRLSRTLSRESMVRRGQIRPKTSSRQSSVATTVDPSSELPTHPDDAPSKPGLQPGSQPDPEAMEAPSPIDPAAVPLPLTDHDVDEIEVPGYQADWAAVPGSRTAARRPRSLLLQNPTLPASPAAAMAKDVRGRPARSYSLPGGAYDDRSRAWGAGAIVAPDDDEERAPAARAAAPTTTGPEEGTNVQSGNPMSSSVSSLDSTAAGLAPPSDLSAGPSPITHEDDEMMQRRARSQTPPSAAEPLPDRPSTASAVPPTAGISSAQDHRPLPRPADASNMAPSPQPFSARDHRPGQPSSIVETSFVATRTVSQPPRLTPLREMVQAAAETPVEEEQEEEEEEEERTSSARPSDAPATAPAGRPDPRLADSPRSQASPARSWKYPSKSPRAGAPRYVEPVSGIERAAVQRVSSTPNRSLRREPSLASHRSESVSSARDKRPRTSGSTTSQVSSRLKGIVGRPSFEATRTTAKAADHTREPSNLDELIQSEETIRYTLTPRNMREMEDPDSPRWASVRAESTNTPEPETTSMRSASRPVSKPQSVGQTSAKGSSQSRRTKPSPYQPRDARTDRERESLREFAEFIRSTGPPASTTVPEGDRPPATANTSGSAQSTKRTTTRRAGPKLEARPAVAPRDRQTSDLIDFIREGPPSEAHRIPRSVAPFRTTMDSDDFRAQSSAASVQAASVISTNSRTALLMDLTNRADGGGDRTRPPAQSSHPGGPVRKQRKPRDPYAIDSDSDDEDPDDGPSTTHEESLADFLRNVPPPPDNDQPPQLLSVNAAAAAAAATAPKGTKPRSKSMNMRARLRRTTSTERVPKPKMSLSSLQSFKSGGHSATAAATSPSKTSPGLPPVPRIYPPRDNPLANGANYFAHVSGPLPRPAAKLTPRVDAPYPPVGGYQSETAALADFLKNTGPPEPVRGPSSTPSIDDDRQASVLKSSSLGRMFLRKKKQDM